MKFWLGTHMVSWLGRLDVPLFVSHRRLARQQTWPRARCDWALDSGGFTELSQYGGWQTTPAAYAAAVRRYRDAIGRLAWAAPQDWMCEPVQLANTGLTVADHQRLTIDNYIELATIAADLPFVPVLQGWERDDYHRHRDAYAARGVDLERESLVGLGSVCRRQATTEIRALIASLAPLHLHGFGVKTSGLALYRDRLTSADSMAWSYAARKQRIQLAGCTHRTCANCPRWALQWRAGLLARDYQPELELTA